MWRVHWLPPPCPHSTAVQETVVWGHQLDPKAPPWVWFLPSLDGDMASILDTRRPVGLSLSLFSLKHDPGLPKVSREDRGGLSSHLLCVGEGGTQAFPGGFPPTVQGVEGIEFSLVLPPLLPGHCRHWNGPECTWLPPVVQYRRGPLPKASGP